MIPPILAIAYAARGAICPTGCSNNPESVPIPEWRKDPVTGSVVGAVAVSSGDCVAVIGSTPTLSALPADWGTWPACEEPTRGLRAVPHSDLEFSAVTFTVRGEDVDASDSTVVSLAAMAWKKRGDYYKTNEVFGSVAELRACAARLLALCDAAEARRGCGATPALP